MGIDVAQLRDVAFRIVAEGLEACHQSSLQGPALIEAALGGTPLAPKTAAQLALERLQGMGLQPGAPDERE
jgi:hypothetical protein